ncbi:hypothetical protein [Devosia sp. SD17-2]|uniref:hypothetical protein n=1 Tax=Devosia sp. SD17-2 TaxID=2976459 RepID=UPI0023D8C236|nr:hypothetical protein [Devosia sp. SD17-2]WEJ33880.1 hypothetical protein NYQ88_03435 [Devosia sp. SD17-2]
MNTSATRPIGAAELRFIDSNLLKNEVERRVRSGEWDHLLGSAKSHLFGEDESYTAAADEGVLSALAYFKRGETREALHHLEQALGPDWHGLGGLRPEDLR